MKTTRAVCLKIYVTELRKHDGKLLYEWILEQAKAIGIPGGSVFRAIAGYGRHGRLHEETFFELGSDLPVELEFVAGTGQIDTLLGMLEKEKMGLFYVRSAVESGLAGTA
jgi:PII-like signaling protein